jgi:Acyl-CoA dehydrogenase, N-terminal domain
MSDVAVPSPSLNFELSEEQQLFRQSLRELVDKEFPKAWARELEAQEELPWELWRRFGEHGLTGVGIPEEYGGQGGGIIEQVILDEELSRSLAGLYWLLGIALFDCKAILAAGTEEQKARLVPEIAAGRQMWAISLTEPDGGTDVLGRQRHQDLVDAGARRRPALPRRAHDARRRQVASRRDGVPLRRQVRGRQGDADPQARDALARQLRGLAGGRLHP